MKRRTAASHGVGTDTLDVETLKLRILRVEDVGPDLTVHALDLDTGKHVVVAHQSKGSWAENAAKAVAAGQEVVIEVDESKLEK